MSVMNTKLDFSPFKEAITKQFTKMTADNNQLYRVDVDKSKIWDTYLGSFPKGADNIYRERTEQHDCNCCKNFIRNIGNAVTIADDGSIQTIWDIDDPSVDPSYLVVARVMADLVRNQKIVNLYLHYDDSVGTDRSLEQLVADKEDEALKSLSKEELLKLKR